MREAFEAAYSSGDCLSDAISLAYREDGEYEQSLARLCFKWFCKGYEANRAHAIAILESDMLRWKAELTRSEFMNQNAEVIPDSVERKARAMSAAIVEIKKNLEK